MSVHKKDIKSEIIDYRPVNILSNIFKIFVGFMLKCLSDLRIFSTIRSKHRCGLRKGLSAQFTMHKNPQETADLVTFTGEILNGKPYFVCSVSLYQCLKNENQLLITNTFSVPSSRIYQRHLAFSYELLINKQNAN